MKYFYLGPILLIVLWSAVTTFKLVDPFFLPGPIETFSTLIKLIYEQTIAPDITATLKRILVAFTITLLIGLPVGLALGSTRRLYDHWEFVIDFFRSIPALAIFPLFLLIFGISDQSKIAVASFSATLIVVFNVAYGVIHAKKSRVLATKIMGANWLQTFTHVLFWDSLPSTLVGLRNALSWIIAVIIATEMFVGTNVGLGHKLIDYQITYDLRAMYAVIIVTGIMGYLANLLFIKLEKQILHWS